MAGWTVLPATGVQGYRQAPRGAVSWGAGNPHGWRSSPGHSERASSQEEEVRDQTAAPGWTALASAWTPSDGKLVVLQGSSLLCCGTVLGMKPSSQYQYEICPWNSYLLCLILTTGALQKNNNIAYDMIHSTYISLCYYNNNVS